MRTVLLTGGLGYIGSHVAVELAAKNYKIVILDDLSNSERFVFDRLKEITGQDMLFVDGDVRDPQVVQRIFSKDRIDGVIHLAAKKAVGESVKRPLLYYDVNVNGLVNLLTETKNHAVEKLIFSSSCTVYGTPEELPVTEQTPFGMTPSPYGKTKQMCEAILEDFSKVSDYPIISLRYFNPVGAIKGGAIGELPKGIPNNLVPFITQATAGERAELKVFGADYPTPDGSAIRDYIHVVDLAKAHVKALELESEKFDTFNIGTGQGYSVLEVIEAFEKVNGVKVPYKIADRREGDVETIYGDPIKANEVLGWKAELGLENMMRDAWVWQKRVSSLG